MNLAIIVQPREWDTVAVLRTLERDAFKFRVRYFSDESCTPRESDSDYQSRLNREFNGCAVLTMEQAFEEAERLQKAKCCTHSLEWILWDLPLGSAHRARSRRKHLGTRTNPISSRNVSYKKEDLTGRWCRCANCDAVQQSTHSSHFFWMHPIDENAPSHLVCQSCDGPLFFKSTI